MLRSAKIEWTARKLYKMAQRNEITVAKRILVRTHLITMVPVIWKSIQDGKTDQQIAEWAAEFFNGKRSATISLAYNMSAGSGSAKKESVRKRLEEITDNYNKYFKGREV